ncbi:G patch domain and ankyrin repeat-containing protein 1 homolog [Temnothorax curvispinosus]|uniref:G patch domain and ankyrin repeat-containing protein 1 homolog n=1 Tax=Temnothorax curvispinosus TaxID=300111 RepID=A0A6J1RBV2_9HYME|nr:G patch domain and ankyrin repeat-containing protein 1 homolog [Temnothorax curvispinosus]
MFLQQWMHIRHNIDIPWKTFVRKSPSIQDKSPERCIHQLAFQGNEAKAAYEEIVHQISNSNTPPARLRHLRSRITGSQGNSGTNSASIVQSKMITLSDDILAKVTVNTLLKAVEQKDLKFLQKHMTTENVNVSDDFGWTPLMSAAYCGHLEIVQFLLNLGANKRTRDKSGLTAAQLALKRNYLSIVALLKKKSDTISGIDQLSANINPNVNNINALSARSMPIESSMEHNKDIVIEEKTRLKQNAAFYCEICKTTFQETTLQKHESSTLHIFNTKPKLKNAMYGISRQNKGYRMLLNTGWDEEAGLGPSGKGIKYPIKTCLKMDRKGLGQLPENEYKITHFKSGDTTAVNNSKVPKQKPLKKRDRERLLHREARKERALRIMANEHQKLLQHLETVENKASEILTDREEIIALDKRRNYNRVGMRTLQKQGHQKIWITVGPLLLKMPSKAAEELLEKDQRECDTAINKLRSDLRIKVNELRDLELTPPVPGLMLKPMSHKEMGAIGQILGRTV